jgi:uncharacterized membrane protein YwzB
MLLVIGKSVWAQGINIKKFFKKKVTTAQSRLRM